MKVLFDLRSLQNESLNYRLCKVTFELLKQIIKKLTKPVGLLSNTNAKKGIEIKRQFSTINHNMAFELLTLSKPGDIAGIILKTGEMDSLLLKDLLLEYKVSQVNPDIFFTFYTFDPDLPLSIGKLNNSWLNFVVIYDTIQEIWADKLVNKKVSNTWYLQKLTELTKADIIFVITEKTKKDLVEKFKISEEKIMLIPVGCDEIFRPLADHELYTAKEDIKKLSIQDKFILCVAMSDDRDNNIDKLIKAYSLLSNDLRKSYQLIVVTNGDKSTTKKYQKISRELGVEEAITILPCVPKETLVKLYNLCSVFVYPSLYEGFPFPLLEAARCGAAIVCSKHLGLEGIVPTKDPLFDVSKPEDIAMKISLALSDPNYRGLLSKTFMETAMNFSMNKAADIALEVIERKAKCLKGS